MIQNDKWFYFASGRKASSIKELREVLQDMGEAEFTHHVNNGRNDFANWVEDVFGEAKLAQSMREISDREGLVIILENFLKKKQRKPKSPKKIKRLIIPKEKRITPEAGKELSEKEIKKIIDEAKKVFEKGVKEEEKHKAERIKPSKPEHNRFIVKEFIYGFILGLIFGLIMLGVIFNLKF